MWLVFGAILLLLSWAFKSQFALLMQCLHEVATEYNSPYVEEEPTEQQKEDPSKYD
jgi:hypothetical protein